MPFPTSIKIEMELAPPAWTDVTADVLSETETVVSYGIRGLRPTDRMARPGKMTFHLDNSAGNSGAKEGYYSPGHANARTGFNIGTKCRLKITNGGTDYYKFYGKIGMITPRAGTKGLRRSKVKVDDWMVDAQRHKVKLVDVGTSIRSDALIQSVIDNMVEQPRATDLAAGIETFPFVRDDIVEGKTAASTVLQRAVVSEFGFLMVIGDQVGGGTLKFQDRHERLKDATSVLTLAGGDVAFLKVEHDPELIKNIIDAKVFPRNVGTSPETLAQLDNPFEVLGNTIETLKLNYRDPVSPDVTLSGQNMQDPEGLNSIANRGFETDASGWTAGSGASAAQSATQAKEGTNALKLTSGTGGANQYFVESDKATGFAQNDIVYLQGWIYLEEAWPQDVHFEVIEYDSSDVEQTSGSIGNVPAADTVAWRRISGTYTITDADTVKLALRIGNNTNGNFGGGAVDFYLDEVYLIDDDELTFEFSSADTGGGDKNNDLVLDGSVIGGGAAEYQLDNVSSGGGFVTILKARGDAIRKYNPVTRTAENETSKTDHGDRPFTLNLEYQDDPRIGDDFADNVLNKYDDPTGWVKAAKFHANRSAALLTGALAVEPGQRITITESVTAINEDFYVNGVNLRIFNKEFIDCTFIVTPAAAEAFWLIGVVDSSEIGQTTYVGF